MIIKSYEINKKNLKKIMFIFYMVKMKALKIKLLTILLKNSQKISISMMKKKF